MLGGYGSVSWEVVLIFFNIPFSVTFFVKILSLLGVMWVFGWPLLVLLMCLVFRVFRFGLWLVGVRTKVFEGVGWSLSGLFCFVVPLMLVVMVFCFSKSFIILF